jgi:Ternary complex associated domain 9
LVRLLNMPRVRRTLLFILVLALCLTFLVACMPTEVIKTVTVTQEVQVAGTPVVQEVVITATPAGAPVGTSPPPVPTTQPTQPVPTEQPTQPAPTPTAVIEPRTVELEWSPRMRLGDSDYVRLSLKPSAEGYTITTEIRNHQTTTQTLQVQSVLGYDLSAVARLDGVGFEFSPQGDQSYYLQTGEAVIWRWSLKPTSVGQHPLSVTLRLRWTPQSGVQGSTRETVAYSRSLGVQVQSFFGLTRGQAMTGGLLGLFFGAGLSLFALVSLARPEPPTLRTPAQNRALVLEPRPGLSLSSQESSLLRALFNRYARLVLESEFLSGYSGARTFLAQPIRPDGRTDAYTIVKVGQRDAIRREFENYETFVKDTLPPITARIQHPPVTLSSPGLGRGAGGENDKAALQYTFIGEPGRTPTSLRLALLANPDQALLLKLFETFGPNWWMQRRPDTFRLGREYDILLPTHYVVEPASGHGVPLDGRAMPGTTDLAVGELVSLHNFAYRERRQDGRSFSLRGEAQPGQPPLRLRWLGLNEPNGATGRVVATRFTLLQDLVTGLDMLGLPDPLPHLPSLLNESVSGTQSTIHGDLNLENILVGPGDFVWLIDFAMTRDGHPLFDFAHLEAEIIAHVIAAQIASPLEYLTTLRSSASPLSTDGQFPAPYSLLSTLYDIASRCLFNPSQPREYQLALTAACLGALKYANLDAHQRHLLYLTAAYLAQNLI